MAKAPKREVSGELETDYDLESRKRKFHRDEGLKDHVSNVQMGFIYLAFILGATIIIAKIYTAIFFSSQEFKELDTLFLNYIVGAVSYLVSEIKNRVKE